MDTDFDNLITMENFLKCFSTVMSKQQVKNIFWDNEKKEYKKLNLGEFLEIMKPTDSVINKEVVKT
jgi:Ca2+-binding EF-hand superfamily protein